MQRLHMTDSETLEASRSNKWQLQKVKVLTITYKAHY